MTKIKVEKNVPIKRTKRGQKQIYPFDTMEVGDSIPIGKYRRKKSQSLYGSIYHYIKKEENKHKKFLCGKDDDGKLRVWREK